MHVAFHYREQTLYCQVSCSTAELENSIGLTVGNKLNDMFIACQCLCEPSLLKLFLIISIVTLLINCVITLKSTASLFERGVYVSNACV